MSVKLEIQIPIYDPEKDGNKVEPKWDWLTVTQEMGKVTISLPPGVDKFEVTKEDMAEAIGKLS